MWIDVRKLGEGIEREFGGGLVKMPVPTLLATMFASGFDFSNGYAGITPETMLRAFQKYGKSFIGDLVYQHKNTRHHLRLDPDGYERLITASYYLKWCTTTAKGPKILSKELESAGHDVDIDDSVAVLKLLKRKSDVLREVVKQRNPKRVNFHMPSRNVIAQDALRTDLTLVYSESCGTLHADHNVYLLPDVSRQGFDEEAHMLGDTPVYSDLRHAGTLDAAIKMKEKEYEQLVFIEAVSSLQWSDPFH